MRILVVQESDWLTKGPHQQHHLMDRLSLDSHRICVIDYEILWRMRARKSLLSKRKVFNEVSKVHEQANVLVIRPAFLKIPLLDMLSILLSHVMEINRQIKEFNPDVIVGFGVLNNYLAMKMAKRNNIPFVSYWIDEWHTLIPYKRFRFLAEIIETKTLKNADSVIVINKQLKDFVISMGADPQRTYVVGGGIDLTRFDPQLDPTPIRKKYGIERDDCVLFYMGTVFNFSGLKEVALDLAKHKHENKNLKLLIVGKTRTPKIYDDLLKIKHEYGLENNLILAGKHPYERIPLFLAAADICLLPAYNNEVMRNIVPIKLYEYMISGKPVICTRLPGVMKEFGCSGGILYVDRPTDVVKKVQELIANEVNLEEIGLKARSFAAKFDWTRIVEDFTAILDRIIKQRRNRLEKGIQPTCWNSGK